MSKIQKMSEAEMEVMQVIWTSGAPVTSAEILKELNRKRDWKPTTVFTFLSRLVEKGILTSEKQGKGSIYMAAVTEEEYKRYETRTFLDSVHNGSVKSFIAALYKGDDITKDELEELKKWFSEK